MTAYIAQQRQWPLQRRCCSGEKSPYLASTAVTDKHKLEGGHVARGFGHGCVLVWRGEV